MKRLQNLPGGSISNYTDTYTISMLHTSDNFTVYHCAVIINDSPPITANGSITLNVTRKLCIIISINHIRTYVSLYIVTYYEVHTVRINSLQQ